ncbi:MAG: IgGFc-binding protein [Myxococcales bacterium]|nr:IgGFc-binding protein [Myxococcales bacterium]
MPPHLEDLLARRAAGRSFLALAVLCLGPGACKDDPSPADGTGSQSDTQTSADTTDGPPAIECEPGTKRCAGQGFIETCAITGLEWESEPCGLNQWCDTCNEDETCAEDRCIGPCDVEADLPSSAGCSFLTTRGLHIAPNNPDGLVVANPDPELTAVVQLYQIPEGKRKEEPVGDPVVLEPLEDYLFELDSDFVLGTSSLFRTGGVHRVESNSPIVAYLHAPLAIDAGMDSSMLLPETTAGRHYVVFSYFDTTAYLDQGRPSWFEIVALEDFTTVTWTPTVITAGNGVNIGKTEAGVQSMPLAMNRFDTARVAASKDQLEDEPDLRDVSGTLIESDKPILVWSGNRCARVPMREMPVQGHCDPLQELLLPIDYWGERYIAAASPQRGNERHYWRVYSGYDDVTVTTEPQVLDEDLCTNTGTMDGSWDGTGCTLAHRGSFFELSVPQGTHFFIQGDRPNNQPAAFMPVQYLQSAFVSGEPSGESTTLGDPSMVQSVPVEQFLSRYVFSTGRNYPFNYVQIIRQRNSAAVYLDDGNATISIPDGEFMPVNQTYEVANYEIDEGTYIVESNVPFGIVQMGWTIDEATPNCNPENPLPGQENICYASYAYPGGMKSERINIP